MHAGEVSLRTASLSGAFWILAQSFLNKLVTIAATLLIAFFLSPEEYGVATIALAVATFAWIFPPEVMGDVLIAYPRHFQLLAPTARYLALGIAATSASMTLIAIPVVLWVYDTYPPVWLGGLLAALAVRPFCTAISVVPLSNLRQKLEFRRIAVTDGLLQLAATLLSTGSAATGGRAASIVVPQILNEAARAVCYARTDSVRGIRTQRFQIGRASCRERV